MTNSTNVGTCVRLLNEKKRMGEKLTYGKQKHLLRRIAESLGIGESETLRMAFLQYAEKLSLVTEKVHS